MTVSDAAGRAIATAGQAVIIAGGTVVIAILGLAIAGIPMVTIMGIGSAVVVAVMVLATITLLPALLGFAGHRIDRYRVFRAQHDRVDEGVDLVPVGRRRGPPPVAVPDRQPRRPAHAGPAAHCSSASARPTRAPMPHDSTQRQAYDLVADAYGPGRQRPAAAGRRVRRPGRRRPGRARPSPARTASSSSPRPRSAPTGDAAIVPVIPTTGPQDEGTSELIHHLRDDVLPTVEHADGPRRRPDRHVRRHVRPGRRPGCRGSSGPSSGCRSCC